MILELKMSGSRSIDSTSACWLYNERLLEVMLTKTEIVFFCFYLMSYISILCCKMGELWYNVKIFVDLRVSFSWILLILCLI